jgi:hypothetical protein
MDNPWKSLPNEAPFILPSDKSQIDAFNRRYSRNDHRTIRLDIRPEPYIGDINAPIVLLYLNPGYTADDQHLNAHDDGRDLWRGNVHQEPIPYPFYMLDPRVNWAPGARWWRRTLNKLICVSDLETVSKKVLCIEYFPYHSKGDPGFPGTVPSQLYGFHLVESAIDRGAVILATRACRAWREQVPRLNGYRNGFDTRNPQQAIIGPGNYSEGFSIVCELLRGN